jgi:hypothetical protein
MHHRIPAFRVVRVDPRGRGRHHALATLALDLDQRLKPLASVRLETHRAPRQDRAPGPRDAQIAVVASAPGGLLADEVLQQRVCATRRR